MFGVDVKSLLCSHIRRHDFACCGSYYIACQKSGRKEYAFVLVYVRIEHTGITKPCNNDLPLKRIVFVSGINEYPQTIFLAVDSQSNILQ